MLKKILAMVALIPLMALAGTETVDGIEWTYSVSDGEATVGSGEYYVSAIPSNTLGAITVPSTLGGCPVTRIGEDAFYECKSLTVSGFTGSYAEEYAKKHRLRFIASEKEST